MAAPDPSVSAKPEPDAAGPGAVRSFQTQIGGAAGEGKKLCPTCETRYPEHFRACPRDGAALVEIDAVVGTTLSGTYFVRRALGEGAMGIVYEARHTRIPAKRFAIKMLHPEYRAEPQILVRFAREAEAAATINHPNVVVVVDVDRTPDGSPFLVAEYLEGKELGDHLTAVRKMPVSAAVRVAAQVAGALAAAHAHGIIHRDVKPENVFLTGDPAAPIAKVLDFGISRLDRRGGQQLTQAGAVMGTPSFMPPEQARGDRVDHRADVYALGALLYTAVTGQRPFDRDTPAMTLLAVLTEEAPRPRALEPSIPEALEAVILRAMARDPEQRYATMAELGRALAPFDGPPAVAALAAPAPYTPVSTVPDGSADQMAPRARPALAALLAISFGWAFAVLASTLGAIVKALHAYGEALSAGESALVVVVVLMGLAPPGIFIVRPLLTRVWRSPLEAAEVVRRFGPSVVGALLTYGVGAAFGRMLEVALVGRPLGAGWDVVLLLLGVAGAVAPWLLRKASGDGRGRQATMS